MVFYWNQNATRMPSALSNTFLLPMERQKIMYVLHLDIFYSNDKNKLENYSFSSPEKSWTYKCVNDKCVREHYQTDEKRIPFMSCAMVCGSLNVWPLPTIKASLSSRSLTFETTQMKFDVDTKFADAKQLLQNAYNIFLFDLKNLEGKTPTASNGSNNSKNTANKDNEQMDDGNKIADPTMPTDAKKVHRSCDINKIVINAEILNAPDVYLHMEVDESYELNVTR